MWVSGPRTFCSRCESTRLKFISERFDAIDRIFVGTVQCRACAASLLYSRSETQTMPAYDPPEAQQGALPLEAA